MHRTFTISSVTVMFASLLLALPIAVSAETAPEKPAATTSPAGEASAPAAPSVPAAPVAPAEPQTAVPPSAAPAPAVPAPAQQNAEKPPTLQLPASPAVRFGFVDLGRIGDESKQGKKAQAQVKSKKEKYQAQITAKQKQLEKQKTAIEEKIHTMSQTERMAKAKEFDKKVEEYRKYVQKAENDMKTVQEQATRNLYQEIQKAAAAYGRANGLTAIVTMKELLYLGTGTLPEDVTAEVLKQMNGK